MLSLVVVHYSDLVLVQWAHNIEYMNVHMARNGLPVTDGSVSVGFVVCEKPSSELTLSLIHI